MTDKIRVTNLCALFGVSPQRMYAILEDRYAKDVLKFTHRGQNGYWQIDARDVEALRPDPIRRRK
jgi:hypothetical protein